MKYYIPDLDRGHFSEEDDNVLDDEALLKANSGVPWVPEEQTEEQVLEEGEKKIVQFKNRPSITPSQFTAFAFRMPSFKQEKGGFENFSFEGRKHMYRIYDTPAKHLLLFCGRQVEKSTLIGNIILTYSCLIPSYRSLYVSPSATQTKMFSADRIKEAIETSPVLKRYTSNMLSQNILEKQFLNRSKIVLRYAFLNADRTRGIFTYLLTMDELQDIISDNIPIIEQCTSHAPAQLKRFIYAGTPKGMNNPLEFYRSGEIKGRNMSTMGEWVVPCDRHGGEAGRYWNILGEKNIQKRGLSCEKCGQLIDPMHKDAQWAMMAKDGLFESYRIPQLMVPWKPWADIMLDYGRYSRDRFYNEVLGISYDSGMKPITAIQVQQACNPAVTMHPSFLERLRKEMKGHDIFMGVDWGSAENSYTVMTLGTYIGNSFQIFYAHRFVGEDIDPEVHLPKIAQFIHAFNIKKVGVDYGGGFHGYTYLVKRFGSQRIQRYQYLPRPKKKIEQDHRLFRWKLHRTEIMSDIFTALKRGLIRLPRWEEFYDPYGKDILNIFTEYNETLHMTQYQHRPDQPDDTFHSLLYCFLASWIHYPRPDILVPKKEADNEGPLVAQYSGPLEQGLEHHCPEVSDQSALGECALRRFHSVSVMDIVKRHGVHVPGRVTNLGAHRSRGELAMKEVK